MAQAIATTAYRKAAAIDGSENSILKCQIPALEKMLWGGTLMLIVDHVINGELMLSFPFFTALAQEGGSMVFLRGPADVAGSHRCLVHLRPAEGKDA